MPTPAPGPFQLIFEDHFTQNLALGQFPSAVASRWYVYPYPWSTLGGYYYSEKVVSWHDGVMDLWLHQENGQWLMNAAGPILPGGVTSQLYGRYEIRFRADPLQGYYAVPLLWPKSEVWPRDGEIDWPEGNLTGTAGAYVHHQGATSGGDQDHYGTSARFSDWHTYATEWGPGFVRLYLDGVLIGNTTSRVPNTPMRWVIQITTSPSGLPPAGTSGHLLIDWVRVWKYAP